MTNNTNLEAELDLVRKDVKTDSYPMSVGELVSMYKNNEIILHPEYQRYFRWTPEQKSKLIESMLIGLPLPSFFVAQDGNGNWEVVDGMQRLSTIFDFMGELKDESIQQVNYIRFNRLCDDLFYLKNFANKGWDDFSPRIKLDFKRTKIQVIILMRETNQDAKFELFQRLNSGGTAITGQELRNAILAGQKPEMLKWFEELAANRHFVSVVELANSDKDTRFDMELVLRFMVFLTLSKYESEFKRINSVEVFLTHVLREFIKDSTFDYEKKRQIFENTFEKINDICGKGALKFKSVPGKGKFSIAFFEAVALGIAQNITNLPTDGEIKTRIDSIGSDDRYKEAVGAGKNIKSRIPTLLALGNEYFKK
jgi:uncharacterized protein with ParB-like and HNH nuclease domain